MTVPDIEGARQESAQNAAMADIEWFTWQALAVECSHKRIIETVLLVLGEDTYEQGRQSIDSPLTPETTKPTLET